MEKIHFQIVMEEVGMKQLFFRSGECNFLGFVQNVKFVGQFLRELIEVQEVLKSLCLWKYCL